MNLISRERSCRRKIRHLNYLSALQHAVQVPRNETVVIYPCRFCLGLHVGHSMLANKLMRKLERTQKRIARAEKVQPISPVELQRQQQSLRDLRKNLARLTAKLPPSAVAKAFSHMA